MRVRGPWLVGAIGVLSACSGQMSDQPSWRTQEVALPLASESVPREPPRPWLLSSPSFPARNPLTVTAAVERSGTSLYGDYCAFCHGARGKGDGPVGEVYLPKPADLTSARIRAYPDGLIFQRMTEGFSTMPAFGWRLDPQQRWEIVAHLRELQARFPSP